jgi:hypothetical protein
VLGETTPAFNDLRTKHSFVVLEQWNLNFYRGHLPSHYNNGPCLEDAGVEKVSYLQALAVNND